MFRGIALVVVFGLGCQVCPRCVRYEGGDGTSLISPVIIEGAQENRAVLAAEQTWIRQRFPAAILQRREARVDPLTNQPLILPPSGGSIRMQNLSLDPKLCYEWIEFRTRNGEIRSAFFAFAFAALKQPESVEDLTQLHRCIDLIQAERIHREMTLDELRQVMTSTCWIEGQDFYIEEKDARAYLSEWKSDGSPLLGQWPPVWLITFEIEGNRIKDYRLSSHRANRKAPNGDPSACW